MTGNVLMDSSTENQTKTLLKLQQLLLQSLLERLSPEKAKGEEEEEVLFRLSTSFRTFHAPKRRSLSALLLSPPSADSAVVRAHTWIIPH